MPKKATYHHGDLRRALIDAALVLMAKKDIQSLSLREVARHAGVSHTAPYRHFSDKEALLAVVAEEGFIEFARYLQDAVDLAPSDPLQQLQTSGVAYVRYALDHPTHYRIMFGSFCVDGADYPSLFAASDQAFNILVAIILRGQAAGLIRQEDSRLLALGAWSLVHGLAMLLLENRLLIKHQTEQETLTRNTLQLMIEGLAI